MSKLEINLSSSALRHAGCPLDLHRTVVEGYKSPYNAARLVYGTAFHKYIDTMYKTGGHIPTAREEALLTWSSMKMIPDKKSPHLNDFNHMMTVALFAWQMNVLKDNEFEILSLDGKPATEVTFSLPLYEDEIAKYNWCGTMDRLGKIQGGCYVVKDWKTTSSWNPVEYFTQFEMSRQPRGYVLALKMMHELYPDSALGQIGKTQVGAQFDGVFIKPAANDVKFGKSNVFQYTNEALSEFRQNLVDLCIRFSQYITEKNRSGHIPKMGLVNGSCEGKWGKCLFWNVCQVSEKVGDILLKRDFIQKDFNPLSYNT